MTSPAEPRVPAGRGLDDLTLDEQIAVLLGWYDGNIRREPGVWIAPGDVLRLTPKWSTDPATALGLLCDAMRARGWLLTLNHLADGRWMADFTEDTAPCDPAHGFYIRAATPAEATARAALAALEAAC